MFMDLGYCPDLKQVRQVACQITTPGVLHKQQADIRA